MSIILKNKILAYADDEGRHYHPECLYGDYGQYFVITKKLDDPDYVYVCDECQTVICIGGVDNQLFTKN